MCVVLLQGICKLKEFVAVVVFNFLKSDSLSKCLFLEHVYDLKLSDPI